MCVFPNLPILFIVLLSNSVVLNLFRMTEHLTFNKVFAEHSRKIQQ